MEYRSRRNSHRLLKLVVVVLTLGAVFFLTAYVINNSGVITSDAEDTAEVASINNFQEISSRTVSFGSASWAGIAPAQETAVFAQMTTIGRSNYDEWIIGLDCPLDNIDAKEFCDADQLSDFSKYFGVASIVANTGDAKTKTMTTSFLSKEGIQFFGGMGDVSAKDMCEVVSLSARLESKDRAYQSASLPIVLCAVSITDAVKPSAVSEVQKYTVDLPVWVYIYNQTTTLDTLGSSSRSLYQSYVDAGADIVMGIGDSSLEPVEKYADGLIVYSLGRFMGIPVSSTPQSSAIGLGIEIRQASTQNIQDWAEIAKTCSGYDDLCVEAARSKNLQKPDYTYKYSIIPVDTANPYQPKSADDTLQANTIQKLNWIPL